MGGDARAQPQRQIPRPAGRAPCGMTLLEVMIAMTIMAVVIGTAFMAVIPAVRHDGSVSAEVRLYANAQKALQRIADDLRQAGQGTIRGDGVPYPHFFAPYDPVNGPVPAGTDFDEFNTLPPDAAAPVFAAQPGDDDYGATTQVVFAIPTDADGNGTATDQATGAIEWTPNDMTYCLVNNPATSLNELRRYTDYANNVYTVVATHVERVLFQVDDGSGEVWEDDALHDLAREIRVTIWFRVPDGVSSVPIRGALSTTVSMRN